MTGRLPSVNGVLSNGLSLPWRSNTFVHMLRNVGYRTALIGKSHLQNVAPLRVDDWNYPPARDGSIPPLDDYSDAYLSSRQGEIYENERRDLWEQIRIERLSRHITDSKKFASRRGMVTGSAEPTKNGCWRKTRMQSLMLGPRMPCRTADFQHLLPGGPEYPKNCIPLRSSNKKLSATSEVTQMKAAVTHFYSVLVSGPASSLYATRALLGHV